MGRLASLVLFFVAFGAAPSRAFLWWRDKVPANWTDAPAPMDGADSKWSALEEYDGPGLEMRAMNDDSNLYLSVSSDRRDGRALLSGAFRQDITLWIVDRDGKTRAWGIRMPFSRLDQSDSAIFTDPKAIDDVPNVPILDPEKVAVDSSTSTLPEGVRFQPGLSGKNPSYTFLIPLRLIGENGRKSIAFDFTASTMDPEIRKRIKYAPQVSKRKAQSEDSDHDLNADNNTGGGAFSPPGRSGGGRMGGPRRAGDSAPVVWTPPDSLELKLSVGLAQRPKKRS